MDKTIPVAKKVMKRYSSLWNKYRYTPISFQQIKDLFQEDNSRISGTITKLKQANWITMQLNETDGRRRIYSLKTPEDICLEIAENKTLEELKKETLQNQKYCCAICNKKNVRRSFKVPGKSHFTKNSLVVHHRDGNPKNNVLENLIGLCPSCHRVIHKGNGSKPISLVAAKKRFKEAT